MHKPPPSSSATAAPSLTERDDSEIRNALAKLTGHHFRDLALARTALTHPSLEGAEHYERLEFLGDRVLGLIIARWLFKHFPDENEGRLNRRLTALVRKETLAEIAESIGLHRFIAVAENARAAGVQQQANVLADVLEALVAALYLDGGLTAATRFVRQHWKDRIDQDASLLRDPKSSLQEWAHAHRLAPPVYELLAQSGPDHAPRFLVEARLVDLGQSARGEAGSKRAAEQEAARRLLDSLATGQGRRRGRARKRRSSGDR